MRPTKTSLVFFENKGMGYNFSSGLSDTVTPEKFSSNFLISSIVKGNSVSIFTDSE